MNEYRCEWRYQGMKCERTTWAKDKAQAEAMVREWYSLPATVRIKTVCLKVEGDPDVRIVG